ncbi:unnamed protein product [Linum tenue]|uniref:Uncharacterized protein n=1 Tax=Linum tenue TaxID=586396 RepID=A0AAV0KXD4_9ROSI|nr:unnamed protein product [Linum tenue]
MVRIRPHFPLHPTRQQAFPPRQHPHFLPLRSGQHPSHLRLPPPFPKDPNYPSPDPRRPRPPPGPRQHRRPPSPPRRPPQDRARPDAATGQGNPAPPQPAFRLLRPRPALAPRIGLPSRNQNPKLHRLLRHLHRLPHRPREDPRRDDDPLRGRPEVPTCRVPCLHLVVVVIGPNADVSGSGLRLRVQEAKRRRDVERDRSRPRVSECCHRSGVQVLQ